MQEKGTVKIYRFDPTVDKEPRYETYEVPPEAWRGAKVIDTIRYIYENLDPEISFREPCRQQICGACLMMVNKKQVLACDAFATSDMVIEPSPNHELIKDLAIKL